MAIASADIQPRLPWSIPLGGVSAGNSGALQRIHLDGVASIDLYCDFPFGSSSFPGNPSLVGRFDDWTSRRRRFADIFRDCPINLNSNSALHTVPFNSKIQILRHML